MAISKKKKKHKRRNSLSHAGIPASTVMDTADVSKEPADSAQQSDAAPVADAPIELVPVVSPSHSILQVAAAAVEDIVDSTEWTVAVPRKARKSDTASPAVATSPPSKSPKKRSEMVVKPDKAHAAKDATKTAPVVLAKTSSPMKTASAPVVTMSAAPAPSIQPVSSVQPIVSQTIDDSVSWGDLASAADNVTVTPAPARARTASIHASPSKPISPPAETPPVVTIPPPLPPPPPAPTIDFRALETRLHHEVLECCALCTPLAFQYRTYVCS